MKWARRKCPFDLLVPLQLHNPFFSGRPVSFSKQTASPSFAFAPESTLFSLPLPMRLASPGEGLWSEHH